MEKLYMSAQGLEKLKAELMECRARSRMVADALEKARALGDLRENADYHAAKDEQAMLSARINDIEDKIARAAIVDDAAIDATKAYIGATVRVMNTNTQRESTYVLVSPVEADVTAGKISVRSPVGAALLGKSVGEHAVANVPSGALEMKILEIFR
ncbi:MAG: transcription elongation factor GreA [Candidatus Hydrogenedentes bacterium]|nr:transcription elongation factor GreA [Candidatus Hydrogenedentota bacterium]